MTTKKHLDFDKFPAYADLLELADHPYDLTLPEALSADRIASYRSRAAGYDLLYAAQRVDDQVLASLQDFADQSAVVDQFLGMKRGEIINSIEGHESENRRVLHTAMRDLFTDSASAPDATDKARGQLAKLHEFLAGLDNGTINNERGEPFTTMINIGIGGSDLGPRAVYLALAAFRKDGRKVEFIANVDPDDAAVVLARTDLSRTLVNVVSKSGSTLETLTNEELVKRAYEKAGLDPSRHFVSVTGENSPMDNPKRYLRSFHMYDFIGGRYSATSMVGGVSLGFAFGYDGFLEFLRGANAMDAAAEERNIRDNPPLLQALLGIWNRNFLGCETVAVLPYSQALVRFAAHLQQLDMESNGKSITRQGRTLGWKSGPIVWGEPGTNGQHAFYQLIHQGTTVVPVEFIGFRHSQHDEDLEIKGTISQEKLVANLLAQSLAMAVGQESDNPNRRFPGNRPNSVLVGDRLTPYAMGALLAFYEAKVVFQGFIWNINSFDQEGVQLGKVLANRLLAHFEGRRRNPGYNGAASDRTGWALLQAAGLLQADQEK